MSEVTSACVLIADRHNGLFERIHGLLETTFNQVFLVTDKSSLIEGAGRLQPGVIVMDLSYAAGDLSGLMRELRDHAPAAKLLLLSAHDEPTVVAAAVAAGADGFVVKHAIGRDLMPAIDALLAGQYYFESSAAH
ncbi:MAG: response regulator [Steroidobacteraceae bacterium]|jgi:DNA-binding NarL/FixJ family response regulator